jgi:hypothetical protein
MKVVATSALPYQTYTHPREGTAEIKVLAAGEAAPSINFFFIMVRYGIAEETFATPRHRHTFEQIRYSLEGSLNYAPGKEIPEGWVGYFPEGAFYGPQKVEGGTVLGVQFGAGYLSEDQKRTAQEVLARTGTFHDGIYTTVDEHTGKRVNTDGMEAMWEHIHGQALEYPKARYDAPILIDPTAFRWIPRGRSGIEVRSLGSFTERDVYISMVRWTADADFDLSPERTQLAFTTTGAVAVGGERFPAQTAVWSERGEATRVAGEAGAEMVVWGLPLVP